MTRRAVGTRWLLMLVGWLCVGNFFTGVAAWAEAVSVHASVDQTQVPLNSELQLSVEVDGAQNAEAPDVSVDGFQVQYLGPSTRISVVNGMMTSSVTHLYSLVPRRVGRITIEPITVRVGGTAYQTNPVVVEVLPASSSPRPAPGPQGTEEEEPPPTATGEGLQLQLGVDKTKAYLNEPIPARLQMLIGGVAVRGIAMPTLQADGFLVKPMGQPKQSEVLIGGQPQTLLEFQMTVIPIKAGTLSLGPAALDCQIAVRRQRRPRRRASGDPFEDFFGGDSFVDEFFGGQRLVPMTLKAEPVTITVLPLPEEGRPADFSGAVGQFSLEAKAVPSEVTAGEPVTITSVVRGKGNLDAVTPPTLVGEMSQFKVYDAQPGKAAGPDEAAGGKAFEHVLIPLSATVHETPSVRFSYFDPATGRYETQTKGPFPLTVKPAPAQPPPTIMETRPHAGVLQSQSPEALGHDIVYIKEEPGAFQPFGWRWYASAWWLWMALTPMGLLLVSEGLRRRHERFVADPRLTRASGALRRALAGCQEARRLAQHHKVSEGYAELFRAVQRYVGDRWNLPSEGLTRGELEHHLRPRGLSDDLVQGLLAVFDRCDAARFAPSSVASGQMDDTVQRAEAILKQLERWKSV